MCLVQLQAVSAFLRKRSNAKDMTVFSVVEDTDVPMHFVVRFLSATKEVTVAAVRMAMQPLMQR